MYCDLLRQKSGLALAAEKSFLLDSRLTPVAKKWGFPSLEAMTVVMRGVPDAGLVRDVVEAMTMNDTAFFRDGDPFSRFAEIALPYLAKKRAKRRSLKIWCAACSTGQEPYSVAMTVLENQKLVPGWDVAILATDLSESVLEKARSGAYTQFEAQRGLPVNILLKHFEQQGEFWGVRKNLRQMITFESFNLLDDMTPFGEFDAIFCRNVLSYFDDDRKADVLARLAQRLPADGFLFLGKDESPLGISDKFRALDDAPDVYVLQEGSFASGKALAAKA